MKIPSLDQLAVIYGDAAAQEERFRLLARDFSETYHRETMEFFTSPGRTELIGNHTDHNGGKVIAASIDMDTIAAAYPNGTSLVRIKSQGYPEITVDLEQLAEIGKGPGTRTLVAGMLEAVGKSGFRVSGFDACVSTNVISAAGVSSSASFEMLICTVINYFFNDDSMTCADCAAIGKYAENVYWDKASGMMDQMACALGGAVLLDFSDEKMPSYEKLAFSFDDTGYGLVIVNTGKGHADLSEEYSSVPLEMKEAARVLGVNRLCESDLEHLLMHCSEIGNDRAILRAMHFFAENDRVCRAAEAIGKGQIQELLRLIGESGHSSWEWLQNCYVPGNPGEQKITLALALTTCFLQSAGDGVCRVHGGGFAGVIMCLVPEGEKAHYVEYMAGYLGRENVYPLKIRRTGAVHIPL